MEPNTAQKREEALAFLKSKKTGVLSTISSEGKPRSRLVYYASDETFSIYFITLANTRKAKDIEGNPHASFVIADSDVPQTIQIEGEVADLSDTATIDPLLVTLVDVLLSNKTYGAPINRFDSSKLKMYKISPRWIRWGDFTEGHTTDEVFEPIYPNPAASTD